MSETWPDGVDPREIVQIDEQYRQLHSSWQAVSCARPSDPDSELFQVLDAEVDRREQGMRHLVRRLMRWPIDGVLPVSKQTLATAAAEGEHWRVIEALDRLRAAAQAELLMRGQAADELDFGISDIDLDWHRYLIEECLRAASHIRCGGRFAAQTEWRWLFDSLEEIRGGQSDAGCIDRFVRERDLSALPAVLRLILADRDASARSWEIDPGPVQPWAAELCASLPDPAEPEPEADDEPTTIPIEVKHAAVLRVLARERPRVLTIEYLAGEREREGAPWGMPSEKTIRNVLKDLVAWGLADRKGRRGSHYITSEGLRVWRELEQSPPWWWR